MLVSTALKLLPDSSAFSRSRSGSLSLAAVLSDSPLALRESGHGLEALTAARCVVLDICVVARLVET
jgi:hypothetical protein